jgi:23S rRNA pseudouridine2457 synthase
MNYIYIILHKPYGYLSQFTGETGQKTLTEFKLPKDVYTVGRLDKDSEGLLLLTNNGRIQHLLSHPKHEHQKSYWVQVEGDIDEESIQKLQRGVVIKGYTTKPCRVERIGTPDIPPRDPPIRERKSIPTSWIKITLIEGKNRQVRRMTAHVGYPTLRLIRIQIENLTLDNMLVGTWKFVQECDLWLTFKKKKHVITKKKHTKRRHKK